jgi:hypothetical protein
VDLERVGTYELGSGIGNHPSLKGYGRARSNNSNKRVMEAARLYADVINGKIDPFFWKQASNPTDEIFVSYLRERYPNLYRDTGRNLLGLQETMSVTDYQALTVDVIDRLYYGYYSIFPIVNRQLVRIHTLNDFRVVSRYLLDGLVTPFTKMDPAAPPIQDALIGPNPQDGSPATSTAPIQYQPDLYQAMASINWRATVNDDLGIFQDVPKRLAIKGARGFAKFITSLYVDSNGPNALLYKTGYHNQITIANGASRNNPPLDTQGLIDGINVLTKMKDSTGDPIMITGRLKLWYGSALEGTVQNVMNALSVYVQNQGGVGNTQGFPVQFLNVQPWMIQRMDPVMDPYINIVCTGVAKDSMWGITVDPQTQERPSIEVGILKGFDPPQLFRRMPETARIGGGPDETLGRFDNMDNDLKIVGVFGGVPIDGRSTVASTGLGA